MTDDNSLDDTGRQRLARELGLEKYAELFPDAFDRAHRYALTMRAQMPKPEAISDEPAHVYHADGEAWR